MSVSVCVWSFILRSCYGIFLADACTWREWCVFAAGYDFVVIGERGIYVVCLGKWRLGDDACGAYLFACVALLLAALTVLE